MVNLELHIALADHLLKTKKEYVNFQYNVIDGNFKDLSRKKASDNLYHRTIKMEPIDIKTCAYIEYGVEHNDKKPKFDFGDHVRISKYKNTTLQPKLVRRSFRY